LEKPLKRDNLKKLAQLKSVILGMEKDFGLADMTEQERRILSAMSELAEQEDSLVSSKALRNSLYCADLSAPTYHRALKSLLDQGLLRPPEGRKTGIYRLCL
jgi:DNA-binding transcriptional ArsR family regulator